MGFFLRLVIKGHFDVPSQVVVVRRVMLDEDLFTSYNLALGRYRQQ